MNGDIVRIVRMPGEAREGGVVKLNNSSKSEGREMKEQGGQGREGKKEQV